MKEKSTASNRNQLIAKPTRRRTYELTDEGRFLGKLVYRNLISIKADISLTNTDIYEFRPKTFWGTSVSISLNGNEIALLTSRWNDDILVQFLDGRHFVLKAKGFLKRSYAFSNKKGGISIQYIPKFNWKKFRHTYVIESDHASADSFITLLGLYSTKYYLHMMAGHDS